MKKFISQVFITVLSVSMFVGCGGGSSSTGEDITAPIITILGNNPAIISKDSVYTDQGATATDNVDSIVNVTSGGSVDTSTVGTYIITYSATDVAGNTATALRTVSVVVDTETISIHVSPHILKTAYLPTYNLTGTLTFAVDTQSTVGNIILLDADTGRYSYLSAAQNTNDTFMYTVTDENGISVGVHVNINIMQLPVTINDIVQTDFSSNLPIVIVDTGDREIPDEPKIKGSMTIIEPDNTNRSSLNLLPSHSGYMEIEVRGSSSQFYYPKKQYGVDTELWDEEDDDVSLLGMPKEHKWVLQAPYGDKSLMRNYLAYHKTRQIDESKYYAVRSHFVELLLHTGDEYRYDGVYVLMEKIKRGEDRLNITKLEKEDNAPPEVTGGYIIKKDGAPDEDEDSFLGINGTEFIYVDPKASKITDDQKFHIANYVQQFEFAIDSSDFNNSVSDDYYKNWIDDDSFIMHLLSRELFMDVDTWLFSEYLHKDRNEMLSMSTVWDFNTGMGNNNYRFDGTHVGWAYELLKVEYSNTALRYWMERLMNDSVFKAKVKAEWIRLRSTVWSDSALSSFIADTQDILTESAARNFVRWPDVLGQYVWPNREACMDGGLSVYCKTFDSAVNEHLKTWLLNRAHWMDSQL